MADASQTLQFVSPPPATECIINCVIAYYEEGNYGKHWKKKDNCRCVVNSDEKSVSNLKKSVAEFTGMFEIATVLGLGKTFDVQLHRETNLENGKTDRISIVTDKQLTLELPLILSGVDKLHISVTPVDSSLLQDHEIQEEITITPKSSNVVMRNEKLTPKRSKRRTPFKGALSNEDIVSLTAELSKRSGSRLTQIEGGTVMHMHEKVSWPWEIECGLCCGHIKLRIDATTKGRMSQFERLHYFPCYRKHSGHDSPREMVTQENGLKRKFEEVIIPDENGAIIEIKDNLNDTTSMLPE